ncbi:DUF3261 domain-containing protein [Pseudoalteromonas arctica]|uniref:DUF3261 domain-containing protein n=1 Tax=Pseudoalteromonas arctica TaxID=394751 RepID=A0A7Y0HCB4_9GAMM|nr:DUF3261 domain-containing protein [Pseudoalteromonas arctica]NMM42425.1 DUF3261 domain-containing protein [Pseudoalteromonas arctica]
MSVIIRAAVLLTIMFLTACSTQFTPQSRVEIADNTSLELADPPKQLIIDNWQQVLHVSHQDQQHTLLAQLTIDDRQGINLVVMTVQGMPIFILEKPPGAPIKSTKMLPIAGVDPRYILADIMLVHWPVAEINKRLHGAVMQDKVGERRITHDEQLLVTINFSGSVTQLINFQRNYKIQFQRVEQ